MTEDFKQVERWQELPKGMAEMAALITRGTSVIGYKPQRDGIPEVVIHAHNWASPQCLVAIARLALSITPAPKFEAAQALCEWGIKHYTGSRTAMKGDGWQPEWVARGQLLRAHVMNTWGKQVAALPAVPQDWEEWINWTEAAANNEAEGNVTFVEFQDSLTGEYEVDMFEGQWEAPQ